MGTLTTNFAFAATNFVVAFAVGVWLLVAVRRTGRTAAVVVVFVVRIVLAQTAFVVLAVVGV